MMHECCLFSPVRESKREKLFVRIKRNPKNIRFEDVKKLYEMFGFEVRKPRRGQYRYLRK